MLSECDGHPQTQYVNAQCSFLIFVLSANQKSHNAAISYVKIGRTGNLFEVIAANSSSYELQ